MKDNMNYENYEDYEEENQLIRNNIHKLKQLGIDIEQSEFGQRWKLYQLMNEEEKNLKTIVSRTKISEIQISEVQTSEVQTSEVQTSEIQTSEMQTSEMQTGEIQTDETATEIIVVSEAAENDTIVSEIEAYEIGRQFMEQVRVFMNSFVFLQLGQAIQKKQWQVASMKSMKLTKEIQRLGIVKVTPAMTRIRQNINQRNRQEALQGLSALIQLRSRYFQMFGLRE